MATQVAQLGELGLMGVAISEENGGTGLDYLVRPLDRLAADVTPFIGTWSRWARQTTLD